jgi:hypothetical protein
MEKAVITKNGKTITVTNNIALWIGLIIGIITLYSFVVSPAIWTNNIERDIKETIIRTEKLEAWKDERIKLNEATQQVLHEIVINQKIIMKQMGLEYQTYKSK